MIFYIVWLPGGLFCYVIRVENTIYEESSLRPRLVSCITAAEKSRSLAVKGVTPTPLKGQKLREQGLSAVARGLNPIWPSITLHTGRACDRELRSVTHADMCKTVRTVWLSAQRPSTPTRLASVCRVIPTALSQPAALVRWTRSARARATRVL